MILRVPNPGTGLEETSWVMGRRGADTYLVIDFDRPLGLLDRELRDLYDSARHIALDDQRRPARVVVDRVARVVVGFDSRSWYRVASRAGTRTLARSPTLGAHELAGMVVEHLMDLEVLLPVRWEPASLHLNRLELDAWLAAGYLALGEA